MSDSPAAGRHITGATARLLNDIKKARRDLDEAEARIRSFNRPGVGLSGRILGQTAQDVDGSSERLDTLLNVASELGLTEETLRAALAQGISDFERGW